MIRGFEDSTVSFPLWFYDSDEGEYVELVNSSTRPVCNKSFAAWRKLVGGWTDPGSSTTPVMITSEQPGMATLVYRYWNDKYFMLNAAVAMEAYDSNGGVTSESRTNMTPLAWLPYADRVRSTHWHELFPQGDGRRLLTWKGRFANVHDVVNFYSTEEEVVNNGDSQSHNITDRNYVWYNQESLKGMWPFMLHEYEGGWAFNSTYDISVMSWIGGQPVVENRRLDPD